MRWNRWKPKRTWKGRWPSKILGQVHRGNRRVGEATPTGKLMDRMGIPGRGGRTNTIYRWAGNSQGAGYGFVAFEGNRLCHSENGPLGRICPYEAELYAIRAALNWLVSNPQGLKGNVVIYKDSKSVELVIKSSKIKSTAVQLVLDLIVKVKEACSFVIRWIKGNKGQELADGLAKKAAR